MATSTDDCFLSAPTTEERILPPIPAAPLPGDCCGTGCCPCVHDLYQQDMVRWKKQCDQIKQEPLPGNELLKEQNKSVIQSTSYRLFKISHIQQISSDTFVYTFLIENSLCLPLKIGQHIILKQRKNDGTTISRQYTPISALNEMGKFEVLIKLYSKGKMSELVNNWEVGDEIPWRGPFGTFSYTKNSFKCIVLLAAGTGIAPLYQVIRTIVADDEDETILVLLYSSKTFNDILLRLELLELTSQWNFSMKHFLSQENDLGKKKYREHVEAHRMTKQDVKLTIQNGPFSSTLLLICGTKSFVKDMINCGKDVEINDDCMFIF